MRSSRPLTWTMAVAAAAAAGIGCEPYRIEYRSRPAYYQRLVDGPLPDRVDLEDGTIVLYNTKDPGTATRSSKVSPQLSIRDEEPDGSVVLRAILPEHVIANTLHCIQRQEYELLWDQMIAEETKLAYADRGEGVAEFSAFFRKHRNELAKTLNRMLIGLASYEVVVENADNGVTVCRFWPQVASQFRFKRVAMTNEGFGLKLLVIR